MPQHSFAASYVPTMREALVFRWDPSSRRKPAKQECDAFKLISQLAEGDNLWLMMGSTNAAVALGAFRRGVVVHQMSYVRALPLLEALGSEPNDDDEEEGGRRTKVSPRQVLRLATEHPEAFYPLHTRQAQALEISAAWQMVDDTMEVRKAYANLARSRIQQRAVIYGVAGNQPITSVEELEDYLNLELGTKDPDTKRKRQPDDVHMAALLNREEKARQELDRACINSPLFQHIFGSVDGVGPMIGARFVAAIEQIDRFEEPTNLSNYAGMLPRGRSGKMPSARQSKREGKPLSRSPLINMSCYLLQEQFFGYGAKTELGQMLHGWIQELCPCNKEMRDVDKELRVKHTAAVKRSRVRVTRYFLEQIVWPRWREYMALPMASMAAD